MVVSAANYFGAYSAGGVNLFRWSVDNCSYKLWNTIAEAGNSYLAPEGQAGDTLVRTLRQYNMRAYMTFFGNAAPFSSNPTTAQLNAVKRYVKYIVDRYGAYVDFWELMNETTASATWYDQVAQYLRSIDPYQHPISTSWEQPTQARIEINSPHWYQTEPQTEIDLYPAWKFADWKSAGKPVIVGEQGNATCNWDATSGERMRIRAWSSFFNEGSLIFWNTGYSKNFCANPANIYLGPEERGYLKTLQAFTNGFSTKAAMTRNHVGQFGHAPRFRPDQGAGLRTQIAGHVCRLPARIHQPCHSDHRDQGDGSAAERRRGHLVLPGYWPGAGDAERERRPTGFDGARVHHRYRAEDCCERRTGVQLFDLAGLGHGRGRGGSGLGGGDRQLRMDRQQRRRVADHRLRRQRFGQRYGGLHGSRQHRNLFADRHTHHRGTNFHGDTGRSSSSSTRLRVFDLAGVGFRGCDGRIGHGSGDRELRMDRQQRRRVAGHRLGSQRFEHPVRWRTPPRRTPRRVRAPGTLTIAGQTFTVTQAGTAPAPRGHGIASGSRRGYCDFGCSQRLRGMHSRRS